MADRKPKTLVGRNLAKKKAAKIKAERKGNVVSAAEQKVRAATRARQEAKLAKRKAGMPKKRPSGISTKPSKTVKDGNQGVRTSVSSGAGTKPKKKATPYNMVKSMGSAGMVGKAGTAKPPGGPKKTKSTTAKKTAAKKQGYNARLDESLGARNGKKTQSLKARRDESKGAEKSMGRKSYSGNKSSAQGKRVARKR
jgi:hypothetical protein